MSVPAPTSERRPRSFCLVDSHCHLDAGHFPEGPEPVLERARAAGVAHFVVVGVGADTSSAEHALAVARRHPDVTPVVGMHPHEASALDERLLARLTPLCAEPAVAAVGEIGLDYHYLFSPAEQQRAVFRRMIRLARELAKPIVVHTREAAAETLRILREEQAAEVGGVIHCFSEDWPFAAEALELGFYLSFSGIVTYKNAQAVHEVATRAPAERILVETDCPYLAPVPLRGRRCEPAFVVHTAQRVATLRGVSRDALARTTTENARRLFKLPEVR